MLRKILDTGGAGFIGSNMCEYLLDLEIEVVLQLLLMKVVHTN
ncbi:NAD-dependent epimerase/dehydratase family protein [Crocinitomicaceae bacterium]|nr:NAD-dependent epimerase/dehydratase family protein [Crocinitomicaceae bacterium]